MKKQEKHIHPLLALLIVIGATILVVPAMLVAFLLQGLSGIVGIASVYWLTAAMGCGRIWFAIRELLKLNKEYV